MTGTVLRAGDKAVSKTDNTSTLTKLPVKCGEMTIKLIGHIYAE